MNFEFIKPSFKCCFSVFYLSPMGEKIEILISPTFCYATPPALIVNGRIWDCSAVDHTVLLRALHRCGEPLYSILRVTSTEGNKFNYLNCANSSSSHWLLVNCQWSNAIYLWLLSLRFGDKCHEIIQYFSWIGKLWWGWRDDKVNFDQFCRDNLCQFVRFTRMILRFLKGDC